MAIRARGLRQRARTRGGPIEVFAGIDVDVLAGRVLGIVGPSLAGKTTLINVLAGWAAPDAGEVTWSAGPAPRWRDVAVVPQGFALLDELTVAENVQLPARTGSATVAPERLDDACHEVGIGHLRGRFVTEISVGERQRTMVARALAARPACILADEPVAHQDEHNARTILALLRAAADAGAAVAIATRNPTMLEGLADERLDLGRGR